MSAIDTAPYELQLLRGAFERRTARDIIRLANGSHFGNEDNLAIFRAFQRMHYGGVEVTPDAMKLELSSAGDMGPDTAAAFVDAIMQLDLPTNVQFLVAGIGDLRKRELIEELREALSKSDVHKDRSAAAIRKINETIAGLHQVSTYKISSLSDITTRMLETREVAKVWDPGLGDLGRSWVIRRGSFTILGADSGVGKAQPLDSMVLTPAGFKRMGDISVGDLVVGSGGQPTRVTGVFPQGKLPVYRVSMSDGGSTECCGEHLWRVTTNNHRRRATYAVKSTAGLIDDLRQRQSVDKRTKGPQKAFINKWAIPHSPCVEWGVSQELPLDPYVLGALLGDGCLRSDGIILHNPEPSVQLAVSSRLPAGVALRVGGDGITCRISGTPGGANPALKAISSLGLTGKRSWEKCIPNDYLMASVADRIELLRGLCDTDGHVCNGGTIEYSTSSKELSDGIAFLVRSLGGYARTTIKKASYTYKGESLIGRDSYRMSIRFANGIVPVSSDKHLARFSEPMPFHRTIESIEPIGEAECQCIAVAANDHLYVTDDFIVTHNTSAMLNMVMSIARQDTNVGVLSLEMTEEELFNRISAIELGINYSSIEDWTISDAEKAMIAEHQRLNKHIFDRIFVASPSGLNAEEVQGYVNEFAVRYGVEIMMLDYIQRVGTNHRLVKDKNDAVGHASEVITAVVKSTGIAVVALSVLARETANNKGKDLQRLKHAGQLEHDAHTVVVMDRAEGQDPHADDKIIVFRCAKNRKGRWFSGELLFQGNTQRFLVPSITGGARTQFPA